ELDVVGLNFYPQWSTKQIYVDKAGRVVRRNVEKEGSGFAELIEDFYQRYRAPILITETSAKGSHEVRARWLHSSVATIKQLRSDGVPVYGYTWFPLTTMIDWAYRKGRRPLEEYRIELGLYSLNGATPGGRWEASPLVEQYRRYVQNSAEAVGTLRQDAHEGAVGAAQPHES
ncbi:MAG TPA: hypothetical protein VER55_16645, partial [Ardenticatenaceae bacterium]|nr:hypothetical protein [Ardenticatenaceae bacterium]